MKGNGASDVFKSPRRTIHEVPSNQRRIPTDIDKYMHGIHETIELTVPVHGANYWV